MSSTRSPILAGLLAIAMVTSLVPLLPTGAADGSGETCQTESGSTVITNTSEEGFVALSHPSTDNARISQALFFHVFNERNPTVIQGSLRSWTNGQDAYVVHFECTTDGQEWACIERQDPEATEGFPILAQQPDGEPPDVRIQFYNAAKIMVGDEQDPNPARPGPNSDGAEEDCDVDVPQGAHYAVIYLRDGVPEGVQFADQIWGPYTMDFHFALHRQ